METEIKVIVTEVKKLKLEPDEVLFVNVKDMSIDAGSLQSLGDGLRGIFPNNRVVVTCTEEGSEIQLTAVKGSDYPADTCANCTCGKKG